MFLIANWHYSYVPGTNRLAKREWVAGTADHHRPEIKQ